MSDREEEITMRVDKLTLSEAFRSSRQSVESMIPDIPHKALACSMLTRLQSMCDSELHALREETGRLKRALATVVGEAEYALSGGDDPHDRCTECGLAGYGRLRDACNDASWALSPTPRSHEI